MIDKIKDDYENGVKVQMNYALDIIFHVGYISHVKLNFGRWKKLFYKDASGEYVKCYMRTK